MFDIAGLCFCISGTKKLLVLVVSLLLHGIFPGFSVGCESAHVCTFPEHYNSQRDRRWVSYWDCMLVSVYPFQFSNHVDRFLVVNNKTYLVFSLYQNGTSYIAQSPVYSFNGSAFVFLQGITTRGAKALVCVVWYLILSCIITITSMILLIYLFCLPSQRLRGCRHRLCLGALRFLPL